MRHYIVSVEGNDGFENSIVVEAPSIEVAVQRGCETLGKLTIEQFIKVEADELRDEKEVTSNERGG